MSTEPNAPSDLLALIQRFNSAIEAAARRSDEIGEEEWYERAALESMHSISGADADLIALCSPANLHVLTHYAARPSLSAQAVGDVAFWVQPHLVEMCRQISAVQKEHRVIVATEQTGSHSVPLYTTPPQPADGGDRVGGWVKDAVDAINDGDTQTAVKILKAALAKFQPAGGES